MSTDTSDEMIVCQLDGAKCHSIKLYLKNKNPSWSEDELNAAVQDYKDKFPDAPLLSPRAIAIARKKRGEIESAPVVSTGFKRMDMAGIFGLPPKVCVNGAGNQIQCTVFEDHDENARTFVPDVDDSYVFEPELVKTVLLGYELNIPAYLWGYHGTGKTTVLEQVAARTKRPFMRVQHTINTEESHILGQYVVVDGATKFQPGPLVIAMIEGYVYCADEYDFAMPSVSAVYQPVLEGKALMIKDAPIEMRRIRPHPNFRFVATGNTNGSGDETGLYQGTQIQNAANYSRFGIVEEVSYMKAGIEAAIVAAQGRIPLANAEKLVEFATEIRKMHKSGKLATTISTRELIGSARLGAARGSKWQMGLTQGFINRLSRTDKEAATQYAQRLFG